MASDEVDGDYNGENSSGVRCGSGRVMLGEANVSWLQPAHR